MDSTLAISETRRQLGTLDTRLKEENVIVITRHNKSAFVTVDVEYYETLMETLEILADPEAVSLLQQSHTDIQAGRLHDQEDVKRELL